MKLHFTSYQIVHPFGCIKKEFAMKELFEPVEVGGISLRNRFIRSATIESPFDENEAFAHRLIPIYEKLATNSISAIITGTVGVDENSRSTHLMIKAYGKTFVPELTKLVQSVHSLGAKLIVQIGHAGIKARQIDGGGPPLGPVDTETSKGLPIRGITRDELHALAASFAAAAIRCKEAGADAVQILAAHGYLLSEFLSPYFNKRTDEYGGGIENRARITLEVYDTVRAAVGRDYPVWLKINCKDRTEQSISPADFIWVCKELDKRGINAVEVSGGSSIDSKSVSTPLIRNEEEEGFFAREALQAAEEISASVISVCGYRTPDVIEKWLNKGGIDAIALCRPLISEPDLVSRWEKGDKTKSRCVSCSKCFNPKLECVAFAGKA